MDVAEALSLLDAVVLRRTSASGEWCTSALTASVLEWAQGLGARVELEVPVRYEWKGREVAGRVDAVATFRSGMRLALEVDRTHKPQSLAKLALMRETGCRVLWLRWNEANVVEPTSVTGIRMHWLRIAHPVAREDYERRRAARKARRARSA
jgi:hypothetical protein